MPNMTGVDELSYEEIKGLFEDDNQQESPTAQQEETNQQPDDVSQTKAFAKRLKESTDKVRVEEREAIAKSLGYNSYEELQKSNERKTYESHGLDPDEVAPIVDEMVEQRLASDPRMKELERFRAKQVEEFGKKELAEITKLTNGEITKFEQLPKEVVDLWKQKGSLKAAYLELKGEELILKARSEQSKGSTAHLANVTGQGGNEVDKRPLTQEEKKMWKFFNPSMTDEELNKKMVDKK